MTRRRKKPIPLEGPHADEPEVAGPPDDGGHRGSFTVPADVRVVGETPARAPELHWSPDEGVQEVEQERADDGTRDDAS